MKVSEFLNDMKAFFPVSGIYDATVDSFTSEGRRNIKICSISNGEEKIYLIQGVEGAFNVTTKYHMSIIKPGWAETNWHLETLNEDEFVVEEFTLAIKKLNEQLEAYRLEKRNFGWFAIT